MKTLALYVLGAVIFYYVRTHDEVDIEYLRKLMYELYGDDDVDLRYYRAGAFVISIVWPIAIIPNIINVLIRNKELEEEAE